MNEQQNNAQQNQANGSNSDNGQRNTAIPTTSARNNSNSRFRNNRPSRPRFKGETEEMNGNVFKTLEESRNPLQFKRTIEALQRYCSKPYSFVEMDGLFDLYEQPILEKASKPKDTDDEVDHDVYDSELEQYVKDKKKLRLALKGLYSALC